MYKKIIKTNLKKIEILFFKYKTSIITKKNEVLNSN